MSGLEERAVNTMPLSTVEAFADSNRKLLDTITAKRAGGGG
jgi:hypothetical protein